MREDEAIPAAGMALLTANDQMPPEAEAVPESMRDAPPARDGLGETVAEIAVLARRARHCIRSRTRADNALGAWARLLLGWDAALPEAERARIAKAAAALLRQAEKAAPPNEPGALARYRQIEPIAAANALSRAPWLAEQRSAERRMARLAAGLPGAAFVAAPEQRGFGLLRFAWLVADAGDLARYPTKGHLRKRLGIAVVDGHAQGRPGRGASAADWIAEKYSPERRARLYVAGEGLLRAQVRGLKDETGKKAGESLALGPWGRVYLERKADEARRQVDGAALTPGHAHNRAKRYLEQRFVDALWRAWRADLAGRGHGGGADSHSGGVPVGEARVSA